MEQCVCKLGCGSLPGQDGLRLADLLGIGFSPSCPRGRLGPVVPDDVRHGGNWLRLVHRHSPIAQGDLDDSTQQGEDFWIGPPNWTDLPQSPKSEMDGIAIFLGG